MSSIEKSIEVNVPVRTAYNQWTQFEEFPQFMQGVEEVRQLDNKRLYWHAEIGGKDKEWEAEIVEQTPDQRVAWRSVTGAPNGGIVSFQPIDANRTQVTLQMDYEPEGVIENVGDALGFVSGRVQRDLERFKEFIESRGSATGAWRGEVHGGQVESGSGSGLGAGAAGGAAGYGATAASTTNYDTSSTTSTGSTGYDTTSTGSTGYSSTTSGSTGYDTSSAGTTGSTGYTTSGGSLNQGGEVKVPIVEEQLNVGTREVEGGGVRVNTRVEEVPVNEQVTVRQESVDVHRRPADRPVSETDLSTLQGGTFEVRERNEEVVTDKQARVVEEVEIRKDVQERIENVQDTVRRTDVDVEQTGGSTRSAGYGEGSTRDEGRTL